MIKQNNLEPPLTPRMKRYTLIMTNPEKEILKNALVKVYKDSESLLEMSTIKILLERVGYHIDDWIPMPKK